MVYLLFYWLDSLLFYLLLWFLIYFGYEHLIGGISGKHFLLLDTQSFCASDSYDTQKILNLMCSHLLVLTSIPWAIGVLVRNHFSWSSFKVRGPTLKLLIFSVVGYSYTLWGCIVLIGVIKNLNGQSLGRRYRWDFQAEIEL